MLVFLHARVVRLVEKRQVEIGEIDQFDFELAVFRCVFGGPFANGRACAAWTCAADDHVKLQ
ncbi:hypothetical protein D3C87_2000270 [compost metagenome]